MKLNINLPLGSLKAVYIFIYCVNRNEEEGVHINSQHHVTLRLVFTGIQIGIDLSRMAKTLSLRTNCCLIKMPFH